MSRNVNECFLVGHLGSDPEWRTFGDGQGVASFSLATTTYADRTDWHRVSAFRQPGEFARDHLHKGDLVCVQGRIQYTPRDEGPPYCDIVAHRVTALGPKRDRDTKEEAPSERPVPYSAGSGEPVEPQPELPDPDLPF